MRHALLIAALLAAACSSSPLAPTNTDLRTAPSTELRPPVAPQQRHVHEEHGHSRVDEFYWLRERENPDVIRYLEQENAYTAASMEHTESLQARIFSEIKGRIQQSDETVPYLRDGHWYYTRFVEGGQYPIFCRKRGTLDGMEQVLIDVNDLASGHEYFSARGLTVSEVSNTLAFAVDTVGRRQYTIRFKDLTTGRMLEDELPMVTANMAWANDGKTLFYSRQDPTTLRWNEVYRHELGTDPARDVKVFEELDDTFSCYVTKTRSKRFLVIGSSQTLATETRYLDASNPTGEWTVFLPRERGHEYSVDHFEDHFYVRTNKDAKNGRLMRTPTTDTRFASWTEVVPHRGDVLLEGFVIFADHLVVTERKNGLMQFQIRPWSGGEPHYVEFPDPAYSASPSDNYAFETDKLRFRYTSMTTPSSTFDYDMDARTKTLLKQDEILGGFSSRDYASERLYAKARDGALVPVSLVYRRGLERDGSNPLLLYAYGSYGSSMDAGFSASRLSLLDRGFVYAIAHVRGGEELGRAWYEDGKLMKKKNTFTDFIDCGEFLCDMGYTSPERLFAEGGSAGGLLMGAVANMRPDLFHGIVAHVPFVDVVTTMLDDSIPLTTSEYDEWGNPNVEADYRYMLSYSPYDQVEAKDYPHLLVTTGLHDSQVQYWEPAKWVARLRARKTDSNRLLLKTNMEAGHGGASGRFKRYEETAFTYAFLLDLLDESIEGQ